MTSTMNPASDISKELKSSKTIKTKRNFLFSFNNFKRDNGSIATILTTDCGKSKTGNKVTIVENTLGKKKTTLSEKSKLREHLQTNKKEFQKCSVKIRRLSVTEIETHRSMPVASDNLKNGEMSPLKDTKYNFKNVKKNRNSSLLRHSSRHTNEVDKTRLHLELEKTVSTFASEGDHMNNYLHDSSEICYNSNNVNTVNQVKNNKKRNSINSNKGLESDSNNSKYKFWHLDVLDVNDLHTENDSVKYKNKGKNGKVNNTFRSKRRTGYGLSDSDEEEWQGWDSSITRLESIPGAEIVTVKDKGKVRHTVNLNSRVESDSDLDVEEVLLLTDLENIKVSAPLTEGNFNESDEEWFGWPERDTSVSLDYVFNV